MNLMEERGSMAAPPRITRAAKRDADTAAIIGPSACCARRAVARDEVVASIESSSRRRAVSMGSVKCASTRATGTVSIASAAMGARDASDQKCWLVSRATSTSARSPSVVVAATGRSRVYSSRGTRPRQRA
jgi:hypothetical protein